MQENHRRLPYRNAGGLRNSGSGQYDMNGMWKCLRTGRGRIRISLRRQHLSAHSPPPEIFHRYENDMRYHSCYFLFLYKIIFYHQISINFFDISLLYFDTVTNFNEIVIIFK